MKEEEEKAIERCNELIKEEHSCWIGISNQKALETVLNLIENQKAEIEKRDNTVKNIIHRLENDIRNITKTKADGYTDDYRRCRLQAYKTKTKEIKEYIEIEYFTKFAEEEK